MCILFWVSGGEALLMQVVAEHRSIVPIVFVAPMSSMCWEEHTFPFVKSLNC